MMHMCIERDAERKRHRLRDRERERVRRYKISEEKWMGTAKIGPARDSLIRISATDNKNNSHHLS